MTSSICRQSGGREIENVEKKEDHVTWDVTVFKGSGLFSDHDHLQTRISESPSSTRCRLLHRVDVLYSQFCMRLLCPCDDNVHRTKLCSSITHSNM